MPSLEAMASLEGRLMNICTAYYDSPLGQIEIVGETAGIQSVRFTEDAQPQSEAGCACIALCLEQLDEYFHKRRQEFSVPLIVEGTEFQQRVWRQLQRIPFGITISYQEVAAALGNPKAVRAVGLANGKNPISIIIPCHRVIGAKGNLVGYGGGLWRKEWLLRHEHAALL